MDPPSPLLFSRALAQAITLTGLAGSIDAAGYATMGPLYLSFLSGNSTQFSMAIAALDKSVIFWAGLVILTFVLGSFLGSLLHAATGAARFPLLLSTEVGLLCVRDRFLTIS
jgi:oxalate decarboxylase